MSALFLFVLVLFLPLIFPTALLAADTLPSPWQGTDVGDVGTAGSANGADGDVLHVNGAGSDIWGSADSFHFVYQTFHDGDVATDIPQQDGTNTFAKAGLMIRMSLDPGSPHVIVDVRPNGVIEFMTRSTANGPTTFIGSSTGTGRMRLVRANGVVTGLICPTIATYGLCETIGSTPFPSGAALAGAIVTSHDPSTLNHATFPSGLPNVFTLPGFLDSRDIGTVGLAGTAFVDNGTVTVKGAGSDIWGTSDSFRLTYTQGQSDGEIVARVTSEDAANTFAKAGVIMTAPAGNASVILDVRPNGIIEFMARPSDGAPMQFLAGSAASLPVWLKLERRGNSFTGFTSTDGREWQTVGITSVTMVSGFNLGLAVTSHDPAALNTATFDHVLASSAILEDEDIGDTGVFGQFYTPPDDSYFYLLGSGADIWGTADAFHWRRAALVDDGQMIVHVSSLSNTDTFAKAGLMIRDSLDPSSANVLLDVRPNGSIEFMTRTSAGAATTFIASGATSFPVWLKLARSGSTITGFTSADGSTWIPVGTTSTALDSMALVGVAVTSHKRGVLATGAFTDLSR